MQNSIYLLQDMIHQRRKSPNGLIQFTPYGYMWVTVNTRKLVASHTIYAMLEKEPFSEFLTVQKWRSYVHPKDLFKLLQAEEELLHSGRPTVAEYRLITESGRHIFVLHTMYLSASGSTEQKIMSILQDVTSQKNAEIILETMNENFFELDENFAFRRINEHALKYWQLDQIKTGDKLTTIFPQIEQTPLLKLLQKAHIEKVNVVQDVKDPVTNKWLHVSVTPYSDGLIVIFYDIQDEKESEYRLKEQVDLLNRSHSILNTVNEACYELDANGNVVFVNRQALEWWGLKQDQVIGRNIWDIFPESVPTHCYDAIQINALDNGQYSQFEYESAVLHRWIALSATPTPTGCIVIFRDIHESKIAEQEILRLKDEMARRAEEKYRVLFNTIDQAFCMVELIRDDTGNIVDLLHLEANPAFERQMGFAPTGKKISEIFGEVEAYWYETYERVLKTREPERFERRLENTDSWYSVYIAPMQGSVDRAVVVFDDITDRKRREQNQWLLSDITKELVTLDTIDKTMELLGEKIARHFGVKWCMFSEVLDGKTAVTSNGWNDTAVPSLKGTYRMHDFLSDEQTAASNSGEMTIVTDTEKDARVNGETYGALSIRSFIMVPMARNEQWKFLISITDNKPRQWHNDEIELIKEITNRIWVRVERARAEETLQKSQVALANDLADTRILQEVSSLLLQGDKIEVLCEQILQAGMNIMHAEAGSMQMLVPERNELFLLAWKGFAPESAKHWQWVKASTTTSCGAALVGAKRIIIPDTYEWDVMKDTEDLKHYKLSGIRSVQSTPLINRSGELIGMISTHWNTVHEPTERELRLLDVLARQAADVLERSRAEEALRKSEANLSATFEALPVGIAIAKDDGKVILSNKEMLRYIPSGVLPSKDKDNVWRWKGYGEDGMRIEANNFPSARSMRGETVVPGIEMLYTHDDGHESWISVAAMPVRDKEGNITNIIKTVTDVDQLRRFSEALHKSDQRYKSYFELGLIGMAIVSPNKEILEANKALCEMLGYKLHELLLKVSWDQIIHPDDQSADARHFEQLIEGETDSYLMERRCICKDGRVIDTTISVKAVRDTKGEIDHLVTLLQDITEQKKAARQLRTFNSLLEEEVKLQTKELQDYQEFITSISETVPDMISVMELPSRKITYVNRVRFEGHFFEPETIMGSSAAENRKMTHEEYHDVLDEYYNNFSNASDKELISAEYRAKNMRNEWRWFSVRGKVFRRNEKGSVTHIVNVIEDITERKKSEADIAGLNKALTKSNRELRSTHEELQLFTNVAASNYGEILRSLYIHLEFIVNHDARNLSNTGRANLRRAQSAIHKMRLQTDDLLSLSRLHQVGDRELHVNLNSIIDRTIQEMTTKQDNPGISIDIDPLPVIPGYPSLLAVLFYQLIDNAIKFRRDDFDHRINIRSRIVRGEDIAFENEQKDQEYQIISISDNGIGFPGEEAEKIFGMFYRLHDKSEFRGSGVGLAISRKIMEIHGGFIVADGTPGNGSRFDCYFPTSTGGGED